MSLVSPLFADAPPGAEVSFALFTTGADDQ